MNLKLNTKTHNKQFLFFLDFLHYTNGIINVESVKSYLDTNDSNSWKSNQIKH